MYIYTSSWQSILYFPVTTIIDSASVSDYTYSNQDLQDHAMQCTTGASDWRVVVGLVTIYIMHINNAKINHAAKLWQTHTYPGLSCAPRQLIKCQAASHVHFVNQLCAKPLF